VQGWRDQLEAAVARGRADGDAALRAALEDALARLSTSDEVVALTPTVAVLGLERCAAGWVGVAIRPTGRTTLHVGADLLGLIEQVQDQEELGAVGLRPGESAQLHLGPTVVVLEVARDPAFVADPRSWLAAAGMTVPAMYSGLGFEEGDLLDACLSACVAAQRCS